MVEMKAVRLPPSSGRIGKLNHSHQRSCSSQQSEKLTILLANLCECRLDPNPEILKLFALGTLADNPS
jgi:hypothetical protein